MVTAVLCLLILGSTAAGLVFMKAWDYIIGLIDEDQKPRSTFERVMLLAVCDVVWLCGFKALLPWVALTAGLFLLFYGSYCLVKYRPHWYTLWCVFKTVLACTVFLPTIVSSFFFNKTWFLWLMEKLWPHIDIFTPEGELYLRRWFMTPKGQRFHPRFLHLILLSDEGRDPHDHPGAFSTTILMNGYDEEVYLPKSYVMDDDNRWYGRPGFPLVEKVRVGDTLENPEGHTHIVKLIGPTLTWVKGWKKGRKWGFWKMDHFNPELDVWVESEEYGEKGDEKKSWTIDGK